jgi:hypothetical protein
MKAPQEIKRWIARARRDRGKSNGVVSWLFDHPTMERKLAKNKHLNKRTQVKQALRVG